MRKWSFVCAVVVSASACANNVSQTAKTGPDGFLKGAKSIVLEEGEGASKDIVTYPGGDRVDWKVIELPEGKKGKLDLKMTYTTPRPGLRVAFDVFDQWNVPVFEASKTRGRPPRSATIDQAKGKYFVRVYAPRRKDAAQYKLAVEFHEEALPPPPCPTCMNVPDPPKLPDVPEVAEAPAPTPPGTPPGTGTGPTPPPPPPPPPPTPPEPPPPPVTLRVLKVMVDGDMLEVTLGGGSATSKIGKDWKATVLQGETDKPLIGGGGATIVRVNKTTTVIRVKMTSNQIGANPNVRLSPP